MDPNAKITDLSYLESITEGSREMMLEMIDIFKGQVNEFIGEMKDLFSREAWYDLGLLAHKAKSSVKIMGMDELADMLKKFELEAKAGENTASYPKHIAMFEEQCRQAVQELDHYLQS